MINKCFYHSKDLDGLCSGAIVLNTIPDCKMIGIDYGDPFPWEEITPDSHIIMVDFSLEPFELMYEIIRKCKNFTWIDHHKSAIEKNKENPISGACVSCVFSACELTWRHFRFTCAPYSIELLGLYDIWKHQDPNVLPYQYGLRSLISDIYSPIWEEVFESKEEHIKKVTSIGECILSYQKTKDIKNMHFAFPLNFENFRFLCLNSVETGSSKFDSIWNPEKYDATMVFFFGKGKWEVHMYTPKKEIDLSIIADKYKGGGHKNSCGFIVSDLPFKLPIKE